MSTKAPDHIGNYQVLREIGRGGMGVVYLAQDPGINRQVALKMLPAELAADETTRQRFLREIEYLSTLEHPHIVPTYGVEINDDRPFLVLRYLSGGTLRERLAEKSLSRAELWRMLRQIAPALDYAHGKGLVHRDVKPTNILFDDSGNAYISDFGIAKTVNDNTRLTLTTSLTGTPEYMSPEQFQSLTVDGRADQYSLAIILYQALTGELPFQGDTFQLMYQHVYQRPPVVPAAARDVSPGLAAVVERALAKNPVDRFDSVVEFVTAAENAPEKAIESLVPSRPPPNETPPPAATGEPPVDDTPSGDGPLAATPAAATPAAATPVAATPVAAAPAADDFRSQSPPRVVTGAGGKAKSGRFRPGAPPTVEKKAASGRRKPPLAPTWVWLAAIGVVAGLFFVFSRTIGERASATPAAAPAASPAALPTIDLSSLPPTVAVVAELPAETDGEFIRVVESGVETATGWPLPDDGTPVVIATTDGPLQLRFADGSDLYLAPDTEAALARHEGGYRVQIDDGEVVYHAATDAPVYIGNRIGSWVLVREPGALVGVVSRSRPLEFAAHCLVGSCELKGDLHDEPLQLVSGEAGRVGGSGMPEIAGPADHGRFAGLAAVVATPTNTPLPTATTRPTTTRKPTAAPTTRPPATRRPAAPTAAPTVPPPAPAPTAVPTAAPTTAPPTNTPEPPPDDGGGSSDDPTPTVIVVPTIPD